jgi:hypothetical protein
LYPFSHPSFDRVDISSRNFELEAEIEQANKRNEMGIVYWAFKALPKEDGTERHGPKRPCVGDEIIPFFDYVGDPGPKARWNGVTSRFTGPSPHHSRNHKETA